MSDNQQDCQQQNMSTCPSIDVIALDDSTSICSARSLVRQLLLFSVSVVNWSDSGQTDTSSDCSMWCRPAFSQKM